MLLFLLYSFAVGQMSVFLSGGSVTLWMTVGMDQTNLQTAVSGMLLYCFHLHTHGSHQL